MFAERLFQGAQKAENSKYVSFLQGCVYTVSALLKQLEEL